MMLQCCDDALSASSSPARTGGASSERYEHPTAQTPIGAPMSLPTIPPRPVLACCGGADDHEHPAHLPWCQRAADERWAELHPEAA